MFHDQFLLRSRVSRDIGLEGLRNLGSTGRQRALVRPCTAARGRPSY